MGAEEVLMIRAIKKSKFLNRLLEDTSGAFSLMWAISMTGIVISIGATYDLAQISKAKSIAQYAADNMALTASIAVDFENSDRYVGGRSYSYNRIGGGAEDFTGTMRGRVQYDVDDTQAQNLPEGDKARLLARATVSGTYTPAFISVVPGITNIAFTATSDVSYAASEGSPVSIFFVVDNSGSMGSYDNSGTQKLSSLKSSMRGFMTTLASIDTQDNDIIRTAQFPYSQDYRGYYRDIDDDGVIPSHVVSPKWGTVTTGQINRMRTRSGTDSSGALEDAAEAFPFEGALHDAENGVDNPLKFLVFMTDGANNQSYECQNQSVWVPGEDEYWWKWKWKRWGGWYKKVKYNRPRNTRSWNYVAGSGGGYQNQQVCDWDYWFDQRSLEECTIMKDAGVKIYAIAYDVSRSEKVHAENFMRQCSSGVDYFKSAGTANALKAAFDEIGASIIKEVIRIKR